MRTKIIELSIDSKRKSDIFRASEEKPKNEKNIMDQIKIASEQWSKYLRLKSERSAISKEIDALVNSWQLPEASAQLAGVQMEIVNGNGDAIGKISYYAVAEKVVKATFARRIS